MADQGIMAAFEQSEENYRSHAVIHYCFPPRPSVCTLCGASGTQLYRERCRLIAALESTDGFGLPD